MISRSFNNIRKVSAIERQIDDENLPFWLPQCLSSEDCDWNRKEVSVLQDVLRSPIHEGNWAPCRVLLILPHELTISVRLPSSEIDTSSNRSDNTARWTVIYERTLIKTLNTANSLSPTPRCFQRIPAIILDLTGNSGYKKGRRRRTKEWSDRGRREREGKFITVTGGV